MYYLHPGIKHQLILYLDLHVLAPLVRACHRPSVSAEPDQRALVIAVLLTTQLADVQLLAAFAHVRVTVK